MSFKNTPPASAKLTFPCSECAFEAQSARQLSRHKAVTHTQNALKCVLCPFVTAYQTNLLRHRKDVHGICGSKGNKSCKFCGFVSEDNDTLIQHQIEYHQDILKSAQVKFAKELVSAGGDETFADFEAISQEFMRNKNLKKINLSKKQKKQKVKHNLNYEIKPKTNTAVHNEENNEFDEFWKAGFIDQYEEQEIYYNQPSLVNMDMQNESLNNSSRSSTPKSQSSHNLNIKDLPATRIRRQYSCNDCGFRTVNPREFLYHRRDGHGYRIKIVECPYCVYACQYVQKLQRHLFLVHKLNVSPEMTSSAEVDSMVVKRKYKKSQLAFNGNSILDSDIKHGDKDVSNDDGDYDQQINDAGIEHMNNFEMNLNEYCNDDGNNSKDAIDDNEDDPNYQMNLQCSICKIKFGDIVSAQKHFIKYHKYGDSKSYINSMDNDYSSVQMTTNQKKVFDCIKNVHTCNYCGYKTRWISELERHVRVHSKEKPFKCMFCDFKSKWKGDLNRHIQRYHSNEPTLPEIESDASVSGNPHSTEMSPPTCLMSRQDDETSNDINDSFSPDNDIANDYPNSYECLMQVDDEEFNAAPNTIDSGDNFDADNEDGIQSPNNNTAKMYKCTYCDFMCNTASRFHVHYVQHLNTKPFQCSICGHRSNWEWDVTKHIKMKAQRDPSHEKAQPVLIHDSGKRDYSKYNKFVIWVDQADAEMVNNDSNKIDFRAKRFRLDDENNGTGDSLMAPEVCFEVDGEMNYNDRYNNYLPKRAILARYKAKSVVVSRHCNSRDQAISCLECDFKHKFARVIVAHMASHFKEKPYTCKYCHFDTNWREVIINHYNVEHENIDNMDFAMRFRCIIDQNSICRIISVEELVELEATSSVPYESPIIEPNSSLIEPNIYEEKAVIRCELCPFLTTNFKKMTIHCRFHNSSKGSLKCKYCPYYVNNKDKLIRHQKLHQNVDTSNLIVDGTDSISNYQQPTYGQRPTMISCSLCPFQTKNSQSLNEHMKIHDATAMDYENDMNEDNANPEIEATENRVNECDNTNNDLNELQFQTAFADNSSSVIEVNGMKNGNAKKFSYICTECPAAFKSPGDYKIHAVFHSSDYQHSCPYCTYKARTKPQLCKHLYVHTAEYISKRANSYPDGTKHTVGNQETSQVISQQSSSTTLKKKTSAKQKQPKSGRKQRTKFQFPMKPVKVKLNSEENGKQNIVFNNTGLMANQEFLETKEYLQRIHSGIKNRCMYRCSNCPAVFTKVNTLIYHMTLHDQKDQFTCETCNYSTTTEDNLSIHSLLHNLTESQTAIGYNFNYNCHKCPAGFSKRTRLEKHLSLHGEKFNWKCDKCDYSVRYAATLVKHRALHLINPNFQAADTVNGADLDVESVDKTAAIDEPVAVDSKTNLKLKLNFSKLRQNENAQGKLKMTLNIPESKDNLENPLNHDAEVEDSGDDFEDEAIPQLVMADETEQVAIESN